MRALGLVWNRFKYVVPATLIAHTLWKGYHCEKQQSQEDIETTTSKIFFATQQCQYSDLKLFVMGGQSLGREITSHLDIALGRHRTTQFNDGQISMEIFDSVSGHKVVILKTFQNQSINDGLMELILAIATMKKNGATHVTAVLPYFPYTINPIDKNAYDYRDFPLHHPYASDVARLIESSGCDTIITLNSQINQLKGFSGKQCNIFNIDCTSLAVPYLIQKNIVNPVLVGSRPNPSISKKLNSLGQAFQLFGFDCGYGIFSSMIYVGDNVKDRDVVLFTNVIRSGKRLKLMTAELKDQGARNIYLVGIHGAQRMPELTNIVNEMPIKEMIVTNTIHAQYLSKKIICLSVAKYLAELIAVINNDKSLNEFRQERDSLKYFFLKKIRKIKQLEQQKEILGLDSNPDPVEVRGME